MTDEPIQPAEQPEPDDVSAEASQPAEHPAAESPEGRADEQHADEHQDHGFKEELREGVAKAVGWVVEVGSVLGQEGGDIVGAQKRVAEGETEEFLDRVDGEG